MARYKITVHTSDVDDAGTDGDVYVRFSYPTLQHDAHNDGRKSTTRKPRKSKKERDADNDEGREWTDWAGRQRPTKN